MQKKYFLILLGIVFVPIIAGIIIFVNHKKLKSNSENISPEKTLFKGKQNNDTTKYPENRSTIEINTAKRMKYRNNFNRYIIVYADTSTLNAPSTSIYVNNTTEYNLDQVNVKIQYLKKDGKIDKTSIILFVNVQPGSIKCEIAPSKSIEVVKINCVIEKIVSIKMNFCYPSNNGSPEDQFYCQ